MATANELFAETIAEEPHIVIGLDRKIKIPDSLKRLGVQHDHNIETVTFDCPRYWDDHDMSKMAVYINYMLSNGYTDAYPADNIKAEGDTIHFSWTISHNVTQVPGVVNFLVCVKNADEAGNEVNHWNSELCQEAYISKGMEAEETEVLEQSDLITSLLLRMDSVEKINVQASVMRDLVTQAQTAADTAIVAKNVAVDETNQIKNSFANAIKGNTSGEVIRVDDVSPNKHTINATVATDYEPDIDPSSVTVTGCGKNLLDPARLIKTSKNTTLNEDVFTTNFENGSLFLNGPAYANKTIIPSGLYTITFVPVSAEFNAVFIVYDAETEDMLVNTKVGTSINVYTCTFEATKACIPCLGGWGAADGGFLNEYSYKVQLEVGSTGTEYESFFGNTYTPDANGIAYVTSVSPTTTIFTDTPGVIIDAEYNRDTIKIFDYIDQKIADLKTELQGS